MYVVIAILFFGLLVVIHEFGHFIAARCCGVKVNEFAVGMGPKLVGREKNGTLFSLRAIPFGGYCAMQGEDGTEAADDENSLSNKPVWKKLIIFIAGSVMNFLLGYLIILVVVVVVNWGEAGLWQMLRHAGYLCGDFVRLVWESLRMLFTGEAGIGDLSGPVGIVDIMADTAQSADTSADAVFALAYLGSLIAVNIAVMNLLPIPGLDGGHIFVLLINCIIEKIIGRKPDPKYEAAINGAGLVLLLALMAYVMFQDIVRVFFHG